MRLGSQDSSEGLGLFLRFAETSRDISHIGSGSLGNDHYRSRFDLRTKARWRRDERAVGGFASLVGLRCVHADDVQLHDIGIRP